MAQEKPIDVNAALAKWLAAQLPALWAIQAQAFRSVGVSMPAGAPESAGGTA
jgi:hypothetical protein